jgi:hypothetical protein
MISAKVWGDFWVVVFFLEIGPPSISRQLTSFPSTPSNLASARRSPLLLFVPLLLPPSGHRRRTSMFLTQSLASTAWSHIAHLSLHRWSTSSICKFHWLLAGNIPNSRTTCLCGWGRQINWPSSLIDLVPMVTKNYLPWEAAAARIWLRMSSRAVATAASGSHTTKSCPRALRVTPWRRG